MPYTNTNMGTASQPSDWGPAVDRLKIRSGEARVEAALGVLILGHIMDAPGRIDRATDLQLSAASEAFKRIGTEASNTLAADAESKANAFNRLTEFENAMASISEDAEVAAVLLAPMCDRLKGSIRNDHFLILRSAANAAVRLQALADYSADVAPDAEAAPNQAVTN
ncbi:MAG: hypothetical protein KDC18_06005 [Alphaproteobacteria bacterium]|nr:hypothetical protein [Alphaproteobacteria bacterium]MCB9931427.1 hypothetical protein [Alphaproteobacteria bacterium]